jgi:hypothetical protein
MYNKVLTLSADGTTATVKDATLSDIFTTAISSDSCVTGLYGYMQKAAFTIGGMGYSNKRWSGSWTNFGTKPVFAG